MGSECLFEVKLKITIILLPRLSGERIIHGHWIVLRNYIVHIVVCIVWLLFSVCAHTNNIHVLWIQWSGTWVNEAILKQIHDKSLPGRWSHLGYSKLRTKKSMCWRSSVDLSGDFWGSPLLGDCCLAYAMLLPRSSSPLSSLSLSVPVPYIDTISIIALRQRIRPGSERSREKIKDIWWKSNSSGGIVKI